MKFFVRAILLPCLLAALCANALVAAPALVPVGVSSVDVTPAEPIRLSGYGNRRTPSDGVTQRIYAKALAIGAADRGDLSVILTIDNLGIPAPLTEAVHRRLQAQLNLPRAQFAICSSHTHSAPMVSGTISNLFGMDLPPEQWEVINRYTADIENHLVAVSLAAIRASRPAELFWGQGRATFAKNRRTEGGPVDHDVPVLAARVNGQWTAILANYACHCTTLGGEFNQVCGDWAGYAQEFLQSQFPGATALVAIGCGADANPFPRGQLSQAQDHGRALAAAVGRVLQADLTPLPSPPKGALARFNLAFDTLPTRAQWENLASKGGAIAYHARRNLARLDRGESLPTELPYSVQVLAFGDDLAMVFLPGEVVVDYSLRIKRTYAAHRLWVNANANDVPCYIPSLRILTEGGYEGGGAMVYYDQPTRLAQDTEERIFAQLDRIMPAAFKIPPVQQDKAAPKTPAESLKSFRLDPALEIELVASEPLVIDPVAIDFAPDGRLWVAEMRDYPTGLDGKFQPGGRIKVLSSSRNDGRFDHADTLVDDVPFPTGVTAWNKGALVCAAPDILYIEDTDGDGRADIRKKLFSGFETGNFQARVNCLRWGLDGWLYGAAGLYGATVHSHLTGKDLPLSGRDFRFKPDTGEFEPVTGLTQQGRVRDDFGNWFGCDNGMWMWHFPLPDHYLARNPHVAYPNSRVAVAKGPGANKVYPVSVTLERFNDPDNANHTTSACGLDIYRDVALGADFYHNAFTAEPVHNLIHRLVVQPEGTTFSGVRARNEQQSEFLASTDSMFRPAETRTGPDGALWIVDMYRYVIEHPRWISSNRLAQLDVRAGDQQGRIYRIQRQGDKKSAAWPNLTTFSDSQLVALLGGENGVLRDLAHRLLLDRKAAAAAPTLAALALSAASPGARIQALHLLAQLGKLSDSALLSALRDPSAPVRAHAILLAEHTQSAAVIERLTAMAADTNPAVQLQLAFTLGSFPSHPAAQTALGQLAANHLADPRLRLAILSSAAPRPVAIMEAVVKTPPTSGGRREMLDGLIRTAAHSEPEERAAALALILPADSEKFDDWRLEAANSLLQGLPEPLSPALNKRFQQVRAAARAIADNPQSPLRSRQAAVEIISRPPLAPRDLESLSAFLNDSGLQSAALAALRKSSEPRVADLLLADWPTKSPSLRPALIDALLTRETWADRLLAAIESNSVSPAEVGPAERQRLLHHSNPALAARAVRLFAASVNPDRAALVADYAKTAGLSGHPDRGLTHFAANCAACHSFRGLGQPVGPDLATFREKPLSDFLVAILHPNAVVEPRFLNYEIETRDDRSLSGILSGETASSVTLVGPSGLREILLRNQISSIKASSYSLMPEGFEAALDPQGMADLVAYLKLPNPAPFGAARDSANSAPREMFLRGAVNPMTKLVAASESLDYPSPFGLAPLAHCRQTDGKSRVEWEAQGQDRFEFPVALGFKSQPSGRFTFWVNSKKAFDFDVTLDDASFGDPHGLIHATYRVLENNTEDSSGILSVLIPPSETPTGQPVRFAVTASASASQRWFGIYSVAAPRQIPSPDADVNAVAAAILDDSLPSSARERCIKENSHRSADLLRAMTASLGDAREQNRRIPWIWRLSIAAGRRNSGPELLQILDASLPPARAPLAEWQTVAIGGGLINGLSQLNLWPAERVNDLLSGEPALASRWQQAIERSLPMAADDSVSSGTRYDALRMIAMLPWAHAQAPLARHLQPGSHPELQQGSVSGLLDIPDPAALSLLLEFLPGLAESNRKIALETLENNPARRPDLLAAIRAGKIPAHLASPGLRAEAAAIK